MKFEEKNKSKRAGKIIGYVVGYILFTAVVYFVFSFLNKLPEEWSFFHVAGITLAITLFGILIRNVLK